MGKGQKEAKMAAQGGGASGAGWAAGGAEAVLQEGREGACLVARSVGLEVDKLVGFVGAKTAG